MKWIIATIMVLGLTAAQAGEQRTVQSYGLFCDEQKQVEAYALLVKEGVPGPRAIAEVNKLAGKNTACAPFAGEFIVGAQAGETIQFADDGSVVKIYEVLVVAHYKEHQWIKVEPPTIQFVPVLSREDRT